MSKSRRLRLADLRALYLLVGECREVGADPVLWRRHLLDGLRRQLGGSVALSFEFDGGESGPRPVLIEESGWPAESDRRHFWGFLREGPLSRFPLVTPIMGCGEELFTRDRRRILTPRVWDGDPVVNEYVRPSGAEEMLLSIHLPAGGGTGHLLNISRPPGPPFGARERRLLHLCHREIAAMRGGRLAGATSPSPAALPPRLRQVLRCLLEGDGEKQAAARLGIASSTVHVHVKRLYRALGVSSRGELLARWVPMLPSLAAIPDDAR